MYETLIEKDFEDTIKLIKQSLNDYIDTQRHHPIRGKIKIVNIGTNTKTKESVVPADWMNRVFENASELHEAMNNLASRKGKAPVSYCCIYSNWIKQEKNWLTNHKLKTNDIVYNISYDPDLNSIKSDFEIANNNKILLKTALPNVFISVDDKLILRGDEVVYKKTKSVGYLSSLLQKCIRRGEHNGSLLEQTMKQLNNSPTYNLPDHNFALVSGSRQLVWRSYISIVEDVHGYITNHDDKNSIDMRSLVLLSIVCQIDPKLQLSKVALDPIIQTVRTLQVYNKHWSWRKYQANVISQDEHYDHNKHNKHNQTCQIKDAVKLAIDNMPMMSNDKDMLLKTYQFMLDHDNSNNCQNLSDIRSQYKLLDRSEEEDEEQKQTRMAGMDMHCKPTMLIELQSMLNYHEILITDTDNYEKYVPSLEILASYIWENFSRINFRYCNRLSSFFVLRF